MALYTGKSKVNISILRLFFQFLLSFMCSFRFLLYKTIGTILFQLRTPCWHKSMGGGSQAPVYGRWHGGKEGVSCAVGLYGRKDSFWKDTLSKLAQYVTSVIQARISCISLLSANPELPGFQTELNFLDVLTAYIEIISERLSKICVRKTVQY